MEAAIDLPSGQSVRVFNTHIAVNPETLRAKQIKELAEATQNYPSAIVMGDLNSVPEGQELQSLIQKGFIEVDNCPPNTGNKCLGTKGE